MYPLPCPWALVTPWPVSPLTTPFVPLIHPWDLSSSCALRPSHPHFPFGPPILMCPSALSSSCALLGPLILMCPSALPSSCALRPSHPRVLLYLTFDPVVCSSRCVKLPHHVLFRGIPSISPFVPPRSIGPLIPPRSIPPRFCPRLFCGGFRRHLRIQPIPELPRRAASRQLHPSPRP